MNTVAFHTLGCKVNQYDTQAMLELFRAAGYAVVSFDSPADVYVLNTCTVTGTGDKKSMQLTATEKKLVELYREADTETRKLATSVLKGEKNALLSAAASSLLGEGGAASELLGSFLGNGKGDSANALGSIFEMLGK